MSLLDNGSNGMYMPVAPAYSGNYGGFGNGFGGDGWWAILFLFALMGNGGWGGFGGGNNGTLPYMLNDATRNEVSRGFDTASISSQLSGIGTAIASGFANAEVASCDRAMNAMQTAYQNQIAQMQNNFALQQAMDNCCCENRLAVANLQSDIAREACADRQTSTDNANRLAGILTQGFQGVYDRFAAQDLAAANREIRDLRDQLDQARDTANFNALGNRIVANNEAQTVALERYLNPVARPAYIVPNPNGCGCGNYWYNGNFYNN